MPFVVNESAPLRAFSGAFLIHPSVVGCNNPSPPPPPPPKKKAFGCGEKLPICGRIRWIHCLLSLSVAFFLSGRKAEARLFILVLSQLGLPVLCSNPDCILWFPIAKRRIAFQGEAGSGGTDSGGKANLAMAVQAQYPANVLLSDFRTRNGQVGDHRNFVGVGFGSAALIEEYQALGMPVQARMFNAVLNAAHGQQVPATSPSVFHSPEELACNVKRPRESEDLLSLQCKRPSVMNLADLNQQASGTVSTGLRLAFEDERINSSTPNVAGGDSAPTFSSLSEDLKNKSQQQRDEIEQFLRAQEDHLRQSLAEKRQRHLRSLLVLVEKGVSKCLRDKDLEMEKVNRRNMELEERVKQLSVEAHVWQNKARSNEAMVTTLRNNLQQAVAQSREQSKEGCGDSEADDAESAHLDPNAEARIKQLRGSKDPRDQITCKVCRKNYMSILLLPCRHLCLCRDCEITVDACPLCRAMKNASVEVYMS